MFLAAFFKRTIAQPLLNLLKEGITPEKLALSVGLGLSLGVFPVIGSTTILCVLFGLIFRVNQAAIQLVNYFTYPLQLAFFIPFFQLGAWLFHTEPLPFSIEEIFVMLSTDTLATIQALWWANLRAVAAWFLIGPAVTYIIYRVLTPVFARFTSNTPY